MSQSIEDSDGLLSSESQEQDRLISVQHSGDNSSVAATTVCTNCQRPRSRLSFTNAAFYLLAFILGYSLALLSSPFRLCDNDYSVPEPSQESRLTITNDTDISLSQSVTGNQGPVPVSLLPNHTVHHHSNHYITSSAFFADFSLNPPKFFLDGVGLGKPQPGRLADSIKVPHPTPPLSRHSWQMAPQPGFLLYGCPHPATLKDLVIPSPSNASERTDIVAYFPKRSPMEVVEKGWDNEKHPHSWPAQRILFDTIHHPLSQSAVRYANNRTNWIKLDSRDDPQLNITWNQYVPLVMHFHETQSGARKCRGSSGFEFRLDCYDSLTPEPNTLRNDPMESFTYRTRPHPIDHGNGAYSVRILLEKPGYCHFWMFSHEVVDHEGIRYQYIQDMYEDDMARQYPNLMHYLQNAYFRTTIHVLPANIDPAFAQFASSDEARKHAAQIMSALHSSAHTPSIFPTLRTASQSFQAQLALALRIRRRRECNLDDYTDTSSWTGAWYKLPFEKTPCIRRREQDPYFPKQGNNPPTAEEESSYESSTLSAPGTDPFLGPLCSIDSDPNLGWTWPGYTPLGEPQWVFAREECYIHMYSPRTLWTHWHDQRMIFQTDSNGQDVLRNIARFGFGLKNDDIPDMIPRDYQSAFLNPSNTELEPAVVDELMRTCRDDAMKLDGSLSFSNKFFEQGVYANLVGFAIYEHAQWLEELATRINESDVPIGAFLLNGVLHDKDLVMNGQLSPWRMGVKRRAAWRATRSTSLTVSTRTVNYTYENVRINYDFGPQPSQFDGSTVIRQESKRYDNTRSLQLNTSSSWSDYLNSGVLSTAASSQLLAATNESLVGFWREEGPPSSHVELRFGGALERIEEIMSGFRKNNFDKASTLTRHAVRSAIRRKLAKEPEWKAAEGSVAAVEQKLMSNPKLKRSPEDPALLPLGPIYLWRNGPCPSGSARKKSMGTTTINVLNSEIGNIYKGEAFRIQKQFRQFVDGASASSPQKHSEPLPWCDDLRRDSMNWLSVDAYTVTYPWHWYESHSDGAHYGRPNCWECKNCERCTLQNFVDQWATIGKIHAMTLYKEAQLKHAFNPHSTFTTKACRRQ